MHEDLGLQKGDVAGIWSGNSYNWLAIEYACARLGVIFCTINPYFKTQELDYVLRKAEVKALFLPGGKSSQESLNNFTNVLGETLNIDKGQHRTSDPLLLKNVVFIDGEANDSVAKNGVRIHSLEKLKNRSSDLDSAITSKVSPDDPAVIMFTSVSS